MHRKLFFLLCILALMVPVFLTEPVTAQEDSLSEEEQALLDRGLTALEAAYEISTSTTVTESIETRSAEIYQDDTLQISSYEMVETELTEEETEIDGAEYLTQSFSIMSTEITFEGETIDFLLTGELRRVDDRLFARAEYTRAEGEVDALPEGWVEVTEETLEEYPGLLAMDADDELEAILEDEDNEDDENQQLLETIRQYAESVTVAEETLEDGTPVEVIQVVVGGEGLIAIYEMDADEEDDPLTTAMMDSIVASPFNLNLGFNEDGDLIYFEVIFPANFENIPLSVVDPNLPDNFIMNITGSQSEASQLLSTSEPSDPPVIPEGFE